MFRAIDLVKAPLIGFPPFSEIVWPCDDSCLVGCLTLISAKKSGPVFENTGLVYYKLLAMTETHGRNQ
jgi:hypothetical protein